jgi:SAM-dependent methyltransferase
LGVSDRHYFAWLREALERFERESGELAAIGAVRHVDFWVLAGSRTNPAIEFMRDALGSGRTTVQWLDRFDRAPGVIAADMNMLGDLPEDSCDVLMMTRASYLLEDGSAFLREARRLLRPGGLLLIDWLHGSAETATLGLPGQHVYEGRAYPFHTTYCDRESLTEFAGEFDALIKHVNRPTLPQRLDRMFGRGSPRSLTRAAYLDTLREALAGAGKRLLEADDLSPYFKVLFRDARYLHPLTKKFYLYVLTVLRPVGK